MPSREVFVSSLTTAPDGSIPVSRLLQEGIIDVGISEIQVVFEDRDQILRDFPPLVELAFGTHLEEIPAFDSEATDKDHTLAKKFGYKVVNVASARKINDVVLTRIGPVLVTMDHQFSTAKSNAVRIITNSIDENNESLRHFVRVDVKDHPDAMWKLASEFGQRGINIGAVEKPEAPAGSGATFIGFMLKQCDESLLREALASIGNLDVLIGENPVMSLPVAR